ncbi:MAG: hypothetical protein ABI353_20025 [Isosphaeraceae bacterium]
MARRLPFILLGLMTLAAFGGPVVFGLVLQGGPRPDWPPDRPVEWWTLAGVTAMVLVMMTASIALSVANQRAIARIKTTKEPIDTDRAAPNTS